MRFKTITDYHRFNDLPQPEHPLISIVDYAKLKQFTSGNSVSMIFDFYTISMKRGVGKMFYGQQQYDFDEGVMYFMSPNQVLRLEQNPNDTINQERSGWIFLIHPDFLWNTSLTKTIKQYEFFDYSVNEALWLSDKEEATLNNIIQNIRQEYHSNIDKFSQNIIISHIETLLNYSERFYNRQFLTRQKSNHQILDRLENLLTNYFDKEDLVTKGLPTVQHIADNLNASPKYLSSLLKVLTGQSTQQHIHDKLIDKAKEKLSTTNLSVSEIAYELGFEHSQSFSKLFKTKTKLSPLEFRQSFN
ncbi:MAG: helix-turn-helix transcriptional regulator [Cyclobacteriaceae bacterium]|nr:helix-turn-helix transcriptional regulator [Cyclobacteriaceae bacterium]